MTSPTDDIRNEVRKLIDVQVQKFGQPWSLDEIELLDHHRRFELIRTLCSEMDRAAAHRLAEKQRTSLQQKSA